MRQIRPMVSCFNSNNLIEHGPNVIFFHWQQYFNYVDLTRLVDRVLIVNNSTVSIKIYEMIAKVSKNVKLMECASELKHEIEQARAGKNSLSGFVRWNETSDTCKDLVGAVRACNGVVYRYFKSVHDKGAGITRKPTRLFGLRHLRNIIKLRISSWLSQSGCGLNVSDKYLCYNKESAEHLRFNGVPIKNISIIAYPLSLKKWFAYSERRAIELCLMKQEGLKYIAVFVRGPIVERPDDGKHQLMTSQILKELLYEIKTSLDECFGSGYKLVFKPHPNQELSLLRRSILDLGLSADQIVGHGASVYSFCGRYCDIHLLLCLCGRYQSR